MYICLQMITLPDLVSANALSELGGTYLDQVKSTNSDTIVTSVTYKDSVYAFPFTSNTWFMYYDKSVFTDDDIKSFDTMLSKGKVSFRYPTPGISRHSMLETDVHYSVMVLTKQQASISVETKQQQLPITL